MLTPPTPARSTIGAGHNNNTMRYKVNDRVMHRERGAGTVKHDAGYDLQPYAVEFDDVGGIGHDCVDSGGPRTKDGHGWWCDASELTPIAKAPKAAPRASDTYRSLCRHINDYIDPAAYMEAENSLVGNPDGWLDELRAKRAILLGNLKDAADAIDELSRMINEINAKP